MRDRKIMAESLKGSIDVVTLTALAIGLMALIFWCISMRH